MVTADIKELACQDGPDAIAEVACYRGLEWHAWPRSRSCSTVVVVALCSVMGDDDRARGYPYPTLVSFLQERMSKQPNSEIAQCCNEYPNRKGNQTPNRLIVLPDKKTAGRHHYRDEEHDADKPIETQPERHETPLLPKTALFATMEPGGTTGATRPYRGHRLVATHWARRAQCRSTEMPIGNLHFPLLNLGCRPGTNAKLETCTDVPGMALFSLIPTWASVFPRILCL